jgi:predicted site-specific integrase-resolvase
MSKFVSISVAAAALGVSTSTLRRWAATVRLTPARTESEQRRYDLAVLCPRFAHDVDVPREALAYARVSSQDQRADLERQRQVPELYCTSQGSNFDTIADLGSGMNYHQRGLQRLLDETLAGSVGRLVLTHKDRLLRFGAELVFAICQVKEVEVVIIKQGPDTSFEEELAGDVLEIVTVFSARLYGCRSHKNKKLIDDIRIAVREAKC